MKSFKKNIYAVILAGGTGTRFWPMSRNKKPKQFLNLFGKRSLFKETLLRIKSLIPSSHVLIVTNSHFRKIINDEIRPFQIPRANILCEPEGKNTAPAICWAARYILRKNKEGVMVVLPSDHLILNQKAFLKNIKKAIGLAEKDYLVTLGIVPTRPETGYGYLKFKVFRDGNKSLFKVEKFTEKPTRSLAQKFIRQKRYLWNSGMFVFKCSVILRQFQRYLPSIYSIFQKEKTVTRRLWIKLPQISIDYGILEKAKNVVTIPAYDMRWSDLGSFESLFEVMKTDSQGNIIKGKAIALECRDSLILGKNRLIAAVGLKDYLIVDSDDAVLICSKDNSQKIREVVALLKSSRQESLT